jgi:hypothetical protein
MSRSFCSINADVDLPHPDGPYLTVTAFSFIDKETAKHVFLSRSVPTSFDRISLILNSLKYSNCNNSLSHLILI